MQDLSNPPEAPALDPATLTLDPLAGLASAPTGSAQGLTLLADGRAKLTDDQAGGRAASLAQGPARDLAILVGRTEDSSDGLALLVDGLAGGRAAGTAGGPCGAVGQSGQLGLRSDFSNGCDCHINPIGCTA